MRDLQTSGIVGLSASKVGYRYSDRHGEVNDKKNVAVLPTVPASIRATKGSTGGYTYQGNKVVLAWICPYISRHLLSLNPLLA
ncbi:hypothetical protein HEK87_023315, partial [Escherichia coli]|nr:hypothetical protein [Escherichia coli]